MVLKPNDLQLKHVRQEISRLVSFPEELSSTIDEDKGQVLLDAINRCETQEDLLTLTYSLSRKRLNELFSAVLVLSAASGEDAFNRLLTIFQLRATISLTQTAWAFYQRHYPNDRLGRVLLTLVKNLENRDDFPPFLQELAAVTIDSLLPKRLAERLVNNPDVLEQAKLPIQSATQTTDERAATSDDPLDRIPIEQLQERYPLLAAYTALSEISVTPRQNHPLHTGLCGYMIRLSLLPETPFAAAFLTAYFANANDSELLNNTDLFIQALRISRRASQLILLRRFLSRHRLGTQWDPINQVIRDLFGAPSPKDAPIEALIAKQEPENKPLTFPQAKPVQSVQPDKSEDSTASRQYENENKRGLLNRLFRHKRAEDSLPEPKPAQPQATEPLVTKPQEQEKEAEKKDEIDDDKRFEILQETLIDQLVPITPETGEPSVWKQIDRGSAVRFRQWTLVNQLNRHFGEDNRKEVFFRRYALSIIGVHHWDDETLLIDLGCCYLASNASEEGQIWFYDRNTLAILAEPQVDRPALQQPRQPVITGREAMLRQTVNNIVRLPLDDVNLLYAHDFMQRVISDSQARKDTAGQSESDTPML